MPEPVARWQQAVHVPGVYDIEVDTSRLSPERCADEIRRYFADGRPLRAVEKLATRAPD